MIAFIKTFSSVGYSTGGDTELFEMFICTSDPLNNLALLSSIVDLDLFIIFVLFSRSPS